MDGTDDPRSLTALREWLTSRVAEYGQRPASEVRTDASFAENGLDSMYALMLCGDIEDRFDVAMEPETAWKHRSVDKLAAYLADRFARERELL
jgi:acyl carrier protein